jgi:hypothetical protein
MLGGCRPELHLKFILNHLSFIFGHSWKENFVAVLDHIFSLVAINIDSFSKKEFSEIQLSPANGMLSSHIEVSLGRFQMQGE